MKLSGKSKKIKLGFGFCLLVFLLFFFQNCSPSSSGRSREKTPEAGQGDVEPQPELPEYTYLPNGCRISNKEMKPLPLSHSCANLSIPTELKFIYKVIGKTLYRSTKMIYGVDACEITFIDKCAFKYKNNIYIDGVKTQLDSASFATLRECEMVKDKNGIYSISSQDFPYKMSSDVNNFVILNKTYSKDSKNVYAQSRTLLNVDVSTFALIDPKLPSMAKDKDNIYSGGGRVKTDSKNIIPLGGEYYTDGTHAFYQSIKCNFPVSEFTYLGGAFAKSANRLYRNCIPMIQGQKVHAPSIEYLSNGLLRDKYNYLIEENSKFFALDNMDQDSLQKIGYKLDSGVTYTIYKDKNNVYGPDRSIIEGADPTTFEYYKDSFFKDRSSIYEYTSKKEIYDIDTFEVLARYYQKDKNGIYFKGKKMDCVDPTTFEVIDEKRSRDKNNVYYENRTMAEAHQNSIVVLDDYFSKDSKNIFYKSELAPGLDTNTLVLLDLNSQRVADKNNLVSYRELDEKRIPLDPIEGLNILTYHLIKVKSDAYSFYLRKHEDFDFSTFSILNDLFFKSGTRVYKTYELITTNGESFEHLGNDSIMSFIFKDSTGIYIKGSSQNTKILGDPDTFRILGGNFQVDKNTLFSYGKALDISLANLKFIDGALTDGVSVVWHGSYKILNFDLPTFKVLSPDFAVDRNSVYYKGVALSGYSTEGAQVLAGSYLKLSQAVLYPGIWSNIIVLGDSTSATNFVVVGDYVKDHIKVYLRGNVLKFNNNTIMPDAPTFQMVEGSGYYYKDKNNVYDGQTLTVVTGVDPSTFVPAY